jgi:hypothetical protein
MGIVGQSLFRQTISDFFILKKKVTDRQKNIYIHATPSIRKSWHYLRQQSGCRSVGIVRFLTKATEFSFIYTKMA